VRWMFARSSSAWTTTLPTVSAIEVQAVASACSSTDVSAAA